MKSKRLFALLSFLTLGFFSSSFIQAEDKIGVEEKVKKAYELYLQDQSVTLEKSSWRMGIDLSYTSNESKIFLNQQEARLVQGGLSINYGLTDRIELFGRVPLIYENYTSRDLLFSEKSSFSSFNLGNINLGASATLFRVANGPTITFQTAFQLPTYTGKYLNNKSVASVGLTVYQDFDPAFIYGGFSGNKTIGGSRSDGFGYNAGLGFSLNHKLALGAEINGGYSFGNQIFLANREYVQLTGRVSIILDQKNLIQPSVSFGLNDNTPDYTLGVQWTRRF